MAQILIRGIDDEAMDWFRRRAERLGYSYEQLARELIEQEAGQERSWLRFEKHSLKIRERLRKQGGVYTDSVDILREERDTR